MTVFGACFCRELRILNPPFFVDPGASRLHTQREELTLCTKTFLPTFSFIIPYLSVMNVSKGLIAVFGALVLVVQAWAQPGTEDKLALEYFNSGEFEKAAGLYEKLYEKTPANEVYYHN